jgi:predicted AAA+ superfamily ATPase
LGRTRNARPYNFLTEIVPRSRHSKRSQPAWKNKVKRKPLILRGARQTGKTWLLEHFAQTHYKSHVRIAFDKSKPARRIFELTSLLSALSASLKISPIIKSTPRPRL